MQSHISHKLLILQVAITSPLVGFSADMYQWTDPDTGRLKLGDRPPLTGVPFTVIEDPNKPDATNYNKNYVCGQERRPISIGMTARQVQEAWGRPRDINTTINAYGRSEQWVYRCGVHRHLVSYLYLDDGILTSIQD